MPKMNFSNFLSEKFTLSEPKKYFSKFWVYLAAIQLFSCGLLIGIPEVATAQTNRKSFTICSRDLLSVGLSEEEVANACSAALKPKDLSKCVTKIYDNTTEELPVEKILFNCQRVRRVDELGTCVEKINKSVKNTSNEATVLESCRLSLLPKSFSSCVVGLSANVGLSTEKLLATCLNPNQETSEISGDE